MEPVQTYLKNNKRGLGADKVKKTAKKPYDTAASNEVNVLVSWQYSMVPFFLSSIFFLLFFFFVYGTSKPWRTLYNVIEK